MWLIKATSGILASETFSLLCNSSADYSAFDLPPFFVLFPEVALKTGVCLWKVNRCASQAGDRVKHTETDVREIGLCFVSAFFYRQLGSFFFTNHTNVRYFKGDLRLSDSYQIQTHENYNKWHMSTLYLI